MYGKVPRCYNYYIRGLLKNATSIVTFVCKCLRRCVKSPTMAAGKHHLFFILVIYNVLYVNSSPSIYCTEKPYKFYTKSDWDGEPSTDVRPLKTPVPYVVIHHTYIPGACTTPSACKAAMKSMQNYHKSLDWGDIGYNFCVGSEGGVYEGRGWDNIGIHAGVANSHSIGICLIGDWRVDEPPAIMLESTQALIRAGVLKGAISPSYKLVGHSQVMATECPGTTLLNIISKWDHFSKDFDLKKQ